MLRELTRRLEPHLAGREREVAQALARCRQEVEANAVLTRRDYAFCLYPEAELCEFCTRFL